MEPIKNYDEMDIHEQNITTCHLDGYLKYNCMLVDGIDAIHPNCNWPLMERLFREACDREMEIRFSVWVLYNRMKEVTYARRSKRRVALRDFNEAKYNYIRFRPMMQLFTKLINEALDAEKEQRSRNLLGITDETYLPALFG